jgi:hypothetical protein
MRSPRKLSRPHQVRIAAALAIVACLVLGVSPAGAATKIGASAAGPEHLSSPTVSVSPSSGIHSGAEVTVTVTGEPHGTTLLAIECYSSLALQDDEDACDNSSNAVFWAPTTGGATAHLRVFSTIPTALGRLRCGCLVGVVTLSDGNNVGIVGIVPVSFSSPPAGAGHGPPAPPAWTTPSGVPTGTVITSAHPLASVLTAGSAKFLGNPGAVTGPGVTLAPDTEPAEPTTGVALLQLVLAAPGTSWASQADIAAVIDVKVSTGPTQQIVLFAGARPFTYAAEFGDLPTGHHEVTISVSKSLSTTGRAAPTVRVIAERLSIVAPSNPAYLEMQYAPVVYGRPDTAMSDTPLLSYFVETSEGSGARLLQYTTIWSKEDAGTSFVPWLEWGEWGRMTDITQTTQLVVSATGKISDPMFNSCGCSADYPVNRTSPEEEEVAFHGSYYGTHMIVRNASGNDYQDDTATSAFRIEQPPIAGPAPGAVRESVMDANPWAYRISAMELSRWYTDGSIKADSPEIGDSRQYAILDINCTAAATSAVGVEIQLKGSSTWYSSEFGGDFALYNGGHGRTVVKLPLGWESSGISGLRVLGFAASSSTRPTIRDIAITVIGLTDNFAIVHEAHPSPAVVTKG